MLSIGQPFRRFSQAGLSGAVPRLTGRSYPQDRLGDARDTLDVGVTVSSRPGSSFCADFLNVAPLGYAQVDGYTIGMGGGHTGYMPMRQRAAGVLLRDSEKSAHEEFDSQDPENPPSSPVGSFGLMEGPRRCNGHIVSCPELLHLGWIGLTLNCKFAGIANFILGWTTCDLMGDDPAGKAAKGGTAPPPETARSSRARERGEA
jgi:hypothetical protein